ncbi:hypothetical protein PENTCL1PPCAC_13545, partial [Pristionchus entomophagus]
SFSWSPIGRMNLARAGARAAVLNGLIYVVGGYQEFISLDCMERYDPNTSTWTTLKSIKVKRALPKVVVSCGKIFVFGGIVSDSPPITSVEMYDPETDTWEDREPMS